MNSDNKRGKIKKMSFMTCDLILLVLFATFIAIFLYKRRKKLEREGLLFLYKTAWGIKLINKVGKKYKKTLTVLSHVSIWLGYILMATAFYLVGKIVWLYAFYPQIVRAVKVPPIMPLIPYLPKMFSIPGLPPFYFIYWIIILAIVAIFHEFSHGIFATHNNVKIKSTGFGFFPFFFPVFLAAFVEQDDKQMTKKSNFAQRAILSAGTFANMLTALFFFIIMFIFFSLAFTPAGVSFDNYAYSVVPLSAISQINNIPIMNANYGKILSSLENEGLNEIETKNGSYLLTKDFLERQGESEKYIYLFEDAPAIKQKLTGAISEINGEEIVSLEDLSEELKKYSPGEKIQIKTKTDGKISDYDIVLEENPEKEGTPWIGVGFSTIQDNARNKIISLISFKKPNIYYEPKFDGVSVFIYNLLWWLILICISVAIINMLPVGMFDGGRFFYLTILALTKSEKKAKKSFAFLTYFFLFLLVLVLILWAISFF